MMASFRARAQRPERAPHRPCVAAGLTGSVVAFRRTAQRVRFQPRFIYVGFHGCGVMQVDDADFRESLAKTIDAADALLDFHGIPWQVVVHKCASELEVEPLGCGSEHNRMSAAPSRNARFTASRDHARGVAGRLAISLVRSSPGIKRGWPQSRKQIHDLARWRISHWVNGSS